jgi:hypothetical protein
MQQVGFPIRFTLYALKHTPRRARVRLLGQLLLKEVLERLAKDGELLDALVEHLCFNGSDGGRS